jgi:hypothetical protein
MFSQYCREPFTIEQVEIVRADGSKAYFPQVIYSHRAGRTWLLRHRLLSHMLLHNRWRQHHSKRQ